MNENKIDCLGRIQQNHVINGDFNSELGNCSSQYFDTREASNMVNCNQPFSIEQPPYIGQGQGKSSSTIISRFESPASAFYATEICMGFPQYDCQVGSNGNLSLISQFSKVNDLEFPLYQCPKESLFMDSTNQSCSNFEISNSNPLQVNGDQCCLTSPGRNFLPVEQNKFFIDDVASIPPKANQDHKVSIFALHIFIF